MSGFDNEVLYSIGQRLEPSSSQAIGLMQKGATDASIINHTGNPEGVVSANPSSLSHDPVSGNLYLKQTGTGNTGWVLIGTTAGDLHTATLIVNPAGTVGTGANYSTLAAAMAAAVSGQTIFLMDGTYTENVTLKPGVAISSFTCDGLNENVIINGKLTMTGAGTCTLSGMELKTNSDFFLVVSGSSASVVYLKDCFINCSNHTGISHTSSNASSIIELNGCIGLTIAVGSSLFASTSNGLMNFINCVIGSTATASTITSGFCSVFNSALNFPITTSSTASLQCYFSLFNNLVVTSFTIGGSGYNAIDNCIITGGTQSAISVGSSLILTTSTVISSNTNAITGSGTLQYSDITFSGSSSLINTTTQTALTTSLGSVNILTPSAVSSPQPLVRDSVTGAVGVGSAGGIQTIDGNSGSATGSTVTIETILNSGTTKFNASGSTSTVQFHDASSNVVIGYGILAPVGSSNTGLGYTVFNGGVSGNDNCALGTSALQNITSGGNNCAFGQGSLENVLGGSQNTAVGGGVAGGSITTGSWNTYLGYAAGSANTVGDSSNLYINNTGGAGENNTIRIGIQGTGSQQQNTCFISGITGATASGNSVICSSTGQLATSGVSTNPGQIVFSAYLSSPLSNQTGDGTVVTIPFDSTYVNVGSHYNPSNGQFTPSDTGNYLITCTLLLSGVTAAFNQVLARFTTNISGSTDVRFCQVNGTAADATGNQLGASGSLILRLTSGSTVQVDVFATTGTKTVGVTFGNFSACLLC